MIGKDRDGNGIGEPVEQWRKPIVCGVSDGEGVGKANTHSETPFALQQSDDFEGTMGLQWQWNHNPEDAHWSLTDRAGWLTLRAMTADSLKQCRNQLTQKVIGYRSSATTLVECKGYCRAGLLLSGKYFRGVGICRDGIFFEADGVRIVRRGKFKKAWLRVDIDAERNQHQFWYSIDSKHYERAGEAFVLNGGYWKGIRTGLFCYGESGQAQFDYYTTSCCGDGD